MTPEPRPAAEPFDLGSGELPPALEPVLTDPDSPILLLVAAEADDEAARVAIGLAEARAAAGHATVLADADLDAPRLHTHLDVPNLEGLVDVFLFGASLRRVAVRPEPRHFAFAPAGAYSPDPAEVLQSPRWDRIAEELTGDDALLLVFLPAAAPGARQLSRRIGRAVVLGDDRAVERVAERLDPACRILAAVRPPEAATPAGAPARAGGAAGAAGAAGAGGAEPALTAEDEGAQELSEPLVLRPRKKTRAVSPLLLVALALALLAAAWFGYQELFGGEPEPVPPAAAVEPAAPVEPGAPLETPIPYSVAVAAHGDMETAAERVLQLSRAEPDIIFHLAPVSSQGDVYFRILAGPLADRQSAVALMQRLVDAGHKLGMDDWALLPTVHAFHLGDYDTEEAAAGRIRDLGAAGIPAYIVPQPFEGGQVGYRVYGGAYQNRAEADVMREMLENAGEPTRLVPRVGEPLG